MIDKLHRLSISFVVVLILSLFPYSGAYSQDTAMDLKFQNADLIDVIKILAEKGAYNIVVGPDVSGKVTYDVRGVTVKEALEAALRINGYGLEKKGDIMFVWPVSKIKEIAGPPSRLLIRSYKINYSNTSEIAVAFKENISKYGKITVNKSNNIIIVEDTEEHINKIETIVENLDVAPKQVLIEAKILEIRLNDDTQLGVDWSQVFKGGQATYTLQGANFSLPASSGTPGLFFNVVTPHFNMFLDALQEKGDLKTLSTPKLLTLDNREAEIIIGGRLGYRVTTTINQVTTESVEFLDVGTVLRLTPRVSDDLNILLSIHPEVSDGVITQGLPSQTTTEVTTEVLIRDGESVFIGGLIRDRKEKNYSQVPILGDIPIVGLLFRRTTDTISKTETIIVITPHIVNSRSAEILENEKERLELQKP